MPLSCKYAHVRHDRLSQASAKHAQQRGGSHTGELRPRPDQSRRGSCGRVSVTGGDAEGKHPVMHSGNSRAHFQLLWIAVERRGALALPALLLSHAARHREHDKPGRMAGELSKAIRLETKLLCMCTSLSCICSRPCSLTPLPCGTAPETSFASVEGTHRPETRQQVSEQARLRHESESPVAAAR